jgi:hypothetical protein
MADRLTGKASYFIFDGQQIPITKATRKATRKKADTTDNGDYNATIDLLEPTQLYTNVVTTFAIEGRYRKTVNPGLNSAAIYESNPGGLPVVLGLDASTIAGHGLFDLENYEESVPVDDTVTYTCDMTSNGHFTPNS